MFGNIGQLRDLRKIAQNPSDSELVQTVATLTANIEHDLLDAVDDLHGAVDVDDPIEITQGRDDRRESLLDVAEHASSGDFEVYWFGEVAGFDNPEEVVPFSKQDEEAWHRQIDEWAAQYRAGTDQFADVGDREIVRQHVEETFGVSLQEWEREVIGYRRRDALKSVLAGNLLAGIQGVRTAADAARSDATEVADDSSDSASEVAADGGESGE